jgi:hypothetical protein
VAVGEDFGALPGRVQKALASAVDDVSVMERLWWSDRVLGMRLIDTVAAARDRIYVVKSPADQLWSLAVTTYRLKDITSVRGNFKRFGSASEVYLSTAGHQAPTEMVSLNPLKQMSHEMRRTVDANVVRIYQRDAAEDLVRYLNSRIGEPGTAEALRRCPDCAEQIQVEARVCRFCGYRFGSSDE